MTHSSDQPEMLYVGYNALVWYPNNFWKPGSSRSVKHIRKVSFCGVFSKLCRGMWPSFTRSLSSFLLLPEVQDDR